MSFGVARRASLLKTPAMQSPITGSQPGHLAHAVRLSRDNASMTKPPSRDEEPLVPKAPNTGSDPAILSLARVLARQAAREDHEAERAEHIKTTPYTDEE